MGGSPAHSGLGPGVVSSIRGKAGAERGDPVGQTSPRAVRVSIPGTKDVEPGLLPGFGECGRAPPPAVSPGGINRKKPLIRRPSCCWQIQRGSGQTRRPHPPHSQAPGASWVVATPGRVQGAGAWAQVRKEGEGWVPSQAESQPRVSFSWTCAALTRLDLREASLSIRAQAAASGSVASVCSSVKRRQNGTRVLVFSLRYTKRHRDRHLYTYLTK